MINEHYGENVCADCLPDPIPDVLCIQGIPMVRIGKCNRCKKITSVAVLESQPSADGYLGRMEEGAQNP